MKKAIVIGQGMDAICLSGSLTNNEYQVLTFPDGKSALQKISQDGCKPFVVVAPFDMGDVYTAVEMQNCLTQHSKRTGINYSVVCVDAPDHSAVRNALNESNIPSVNSDNESEIIKTVDEEFQKCRYTRRRPFE